MDKVTVSGIATAKTDYVESSEAAANLTVGAGELMLAVGSNVIALSNQRVVTAFQRLRDRLREANFPVGPLADNVAFGTPPSSVGYVVVNTAGIAALTEDDAIIAYGANFYDAGNSANIGNIIDRAIEVFQERLLKLT